MKKLALLILLVGVGMANSYAQSPWLSDTRLSSVSLEWDKPLFDKRYWNRNMVSGASSALFVTGRIRLNDNIRMVGEIPLSYFGFEGGNPFGRKNNSTVIGNVYIGSIWDINTNNPNDHAFVEVGARIPTTPDLNYDKRFGSESGWASEFADRSEAFQSDLWAVPLIGNFVTSVSGPFAVKARLGSVYDIYTSDLKNSNNEIWLLYGITAMYRERTLEGYVGFGGRNQYVGTPSGIDFWDSGATQFRAGIARPFQNITPGIYVRKPLGDNYNQILDYAYGITLEFRQ